MMKRKKLLPYQPSCFILVCLISILGLSGCAELSTLIDESDTLESPQNVTGDDVTQLEPTPPPTIEEVKQAISSTKNLLDDQQKQIGDLLSLRGEVKQTLREFRDQNLTPMNATIETLEQQVGRWENTSNTNQATLSTTIETLTQDVEQSQNRVGVYGEQVTALVDQIDQNNRQYDTLLTAFQDSLIEFKGTMGEFTATLATEKNRAIQEETTLANHVKEQQQTLEQVMPTAKEILDIQKRLNQLHGYINQVRDTVTSDTAALQTALKNEAPDDLRDVLTTLEQRFQLAQVPSSNPALAEHLETLEQRVEESERLSAERVTALQEDLKNISVKRQDDDTLQNTERLQARVTSLEQQYQQIGQASASSSPQTEHLKALEQRVDESEKHYAESIKTLEEDLQNISVEIQSSDKTQSPEILQARVALLEQQYQQIGQVTPSNATHAEHLQALEQRVGESEKHYTEKVETLRKDVQKFWKEILETNKTQDTENLQAAVVSLEKRYQQLGQTSASNPALTAQLQALEQRVEESEKHYAESMKSLHEDIKELSVGIQTGLNTEETKKLQALVASLEQRYQQLAHTPSSNPALTKHLKALEQRMQDSEIQSATTIKALQYDLQKVSSRMATLTQSIGAETVEALHHDIQEVSAGMLKLAQSISHLEKTKSLTKPIQAGSITSPESLR